MAALKRFTWEQVAEHNVAGDAYLAIRGKVYDVSTYVESHPGGREQLLLGAGRDCTHVFESYHKPETFKFIEKFCIGELISNELPVFPPQSQFQTVLRNRVAAHFKKTNQDPKWAPWMFVRYFFIFGFFLAGYGTQLAYGGSDKFAAAVLGAIVMGFCGAFIGLMPMHDCSHFSITHSPLIWKWLGAMHDLFNGASFHVWEYQHMLGHHPYTNIDDADPDVMTASKEVVDIRRIKPTQTWFPVYLKQHIYVPIIYALLSIKTRVQDVIITFVLKRNGSIRMNPLPTSGFLVFVLGKVLFIYSRFVLPLRFMTFTEMVILYFIQDAVSSWWLALSFQASHVVGEVDWPVADKDNKISTDWSELQIRTTMDYATDSWFWTLVTGALNHQTTHHLFPGISQYYYRQVTPIVVATCKEFNIPYHYKPTFSQALGAHLNHLENMGLAPISPSDKKK